MTSVSRYSRFGGTAAWIAWLAVAALGAYLFLAIRLPGRPDTPRDNATGLASPVSASRAALTDADWTIFRNTSAEMPVAGELAAEYRLAGTFLEYGTGVANQRVAIVSTLATGKESLVREGDQLDESVEVVRVLHDRVVLREGEREEQLWLTFTPGSGASGTGPDGRTGGGDPVQAGLSKFGGKRVGENRWVFSRQKLLDYYTELMNEPERLVKVFDSLHPLYNDQRKIEGYELRVEGEPEFFDSVGFREGDIVRSVNKLAMTNRRRAEFFIKQFVEGRASAFVIDIERGGSSVKHTYQMR